MQYDLVGFWNNVEFLKPPFVHPKDLDVLLVDDGKHIFTEANDFDSYTRSAHFGRRDRRFHTSLLPIPYGGNLSRADIFILLLNPGLSHADYFGEFEVPEFRKRIERNLAQDFENEEFPFFWLDPKFSWSSGFIWWEKKLRDIIALVANENFGGHYLKALRDISRRLALIELVPYHSSHFGGSPLIESLESSRVAKGYVANVLMPDVERGTKTVVATRGAKTWNLGKSSENCVIYTGGQARGASLGPNTPGGRAILNRLKLSPQAA